MPDTYRNIKQQIQQSRFAQAMDDAKSALREAPNDQELLYLLAVSQRFMKHPDESISTLNKLLDLNPSHGRAHQEAGYCHLALGDKATARQAFHFATIANPALVSAWQQLKMLNTDNLDTDTHVGQQIARLTILPKPILGAMDLMYEGKYALAEQVCRQYLQKDKHHPEGMCLLAEIGIRSKVYDDAAFLLETCIELHPNFHPAKKLWADLLNTLGQHHRALVVLNEYMVDNPDDILAKTALANSLIGVGDVDHGITVFRNILEKSPGKAGIHLQLGHAFKAKGDIQQAVQAYQTAYQLKPGFGDAYWSLANTKTYMFSDDELSTMRRFVDQSHGEHLDRIQFCFALAKALEDRREFAESFHYYQLGNQLKSNTTGYDPEHQSKLVDLQIQHCNAQLFAKKRKGNTSPAPIFIVGLPRAGSTLLEQIISSHSQVDATMELHNILGMAMKLRGRMTNDLPAYPANLHTLTETQLIQLGDKFMEDTRHYRRGAPMFIDKMPNNFMHIGLIKLILPNAKIIDARREPMACCFSGFKQLFGEGQEFSYDLKSIGHYYLDYLRLMKHWHQELSGEILTVHHEDVVENLEGEVRRILDFCGLPFEDACLHFHLNKRVIKTPSSEQVRQPIYRSGMEQWKNYDLFLEPLKKVLSVTLNPPL